MPVCDDMVPSLFPLQGQFAPQRELANRTLANLLHSPFTPWTFGSLAKSKMSYIYDDRGKPLFHAAAVQIAERVPSGL